MEKMTNDKNEGGKMKTDEEKCCGNCELFEGEDLWGIGFCVASMELVLCSWSCHDWERRTDYGNP